MTPRLKIATLYLIGFALDVASMFILNAALPALQKELQATVAETAWVGTLHVLGLTIAIPLGGWLGQRFGERRVFVASLLVACAGALGAASVTGIGLLLACRFVQGLGGGLLVPVGQAMAYRAYPPEARAGLTSLVMTAGLIVPACAPTIGGIVADQVSWRWIFSSLALISIATAGLASTWLPIDRKAAPAHARFDLSGFLLGTMFLACLPLGLTLAGQRATLMKAGGLLAVAALSGAAYIRHARHTADPILRLDLLAMPVLRAGSLIYLCVPGMFTGVNLIASLYLQDEIGLSATGTGLLMLPWAIASCVAILGSRRVLPASGARPLFVTGMIVTALGTLLLASSMVHTAVGRLLAFTLMGLGASVCTSTAQTSAFTAVPTTRMTEASTLWSINRQLSFALGSSVMSGILSSLLALLRSGDPALTYRICFIIAAVLMLLPLPVVLRLPRHADQSLIDEQDIA